MSQYAWKTCSDLHNALHWRRHESLLLFYTTNSKITHLTVSLGHTFNLILLLDGIAAKNSSTLVTLCNLVVMYKVMHTQQVDLQYMTWCWTVKVSTRNTYWCKCLPATPQSMTRGLCKIRCNMRESCIFPYCLKKRKLKTRLFCDAWPLAAPWYNYFCDCCVGQ